MKSPQSKTFNPVKAKSLQEIIEGFEPKEVRCIVCGKRHFPDEETFLTIYGNITVGLFDGIVGNNFSEDGTLGRLNFVCYSEKCISKLLHTNFNKGEECMSGLEMKYFVLKPKSACKYDIYARASRAAMTTYAKVIRSYNEQLADDLEEWVRNEISDEFSLKDGTQ